MQRKIQQQIGDTDTNKVQELNIISSKVSVISTQDQLYLQTFKNLSFLSINKSFLSSLNNFPVLPSLIHLDLSHNSIKENLKPLVNLHSLMHLGLSYNQISDIKQISCLQNMTHLVSLELFDNPIESLENYRSLIFTLIPSLKSLDGSDENDEDVSVLSSEECQDELSSLSEELPDSDSESDLSLSEHLNISRSKRLRESHSDLTLRKTLKES